MLPGNGKQVIDRLILVYNADSGAFAAFVDSANVSER